MESKLDRKVGVRLDDELEARLVEYRARVRRDTGLSVGNGAAIRALLGAALDAAGIPAGAAGVFSGRACAVCGWHETARNRAQSPDRCSSCGERW